MKLENSQILIAYYSRKGNNYVNGSIVNLSIGNTEVIAKMIHDFMGGAIFQIETIKKYPDDYESTTEVAKQELRNNARPELSKKVENMAMYNIIFLGYPNWWGTMPMAVHLFLESYDISGKIIIPFCTHEGSGLGNSVRDIKKICPKSEIKNAIAFRGGNVSNSKLDVENWINE
jgi:flavodoxin